VEKMKTRVGFVSNSSSSSFVVIAKRVNFNKITMEDIETRNITCLGKYLCDAQDVFQLTPALFEAITILGPHDAMTFYEVILNEETIKAKDLIKVLGEDPKATVEFLGVEADYYSTESVDRLIINYYEDSVKELKTISEYMAAKKKLEKLDVDDNLNRLKELMEYES
jgi:hypothetical protein